MRLISAQVKNFASYKNLEFSYENLGLALVYGATGSGKSTLADIAPWVLFGTTAKDGGVDEVRSWVSPNEATEGRLTVQLTHSTIIITRIRGKASENDLYWQHYGDTSDSGGPHAHRGKDLSDSQKLLNGLLGFDAYTYLAAACFSEFSTVGGFFTAKAKDRRSVLRRVDESSVAARLGDACSAARKQVKTQISEVQKEMYGQEATLKQIKETIDYTEKRIHAWNKEHAALLVDLKDKATNFDAIKDEDLRVASDLKSMWDSIQADNLKALKLRSQDMEAILEDLQDRTQEVNATKQVIETLRTTRCPTCGGPNKSDKIEYLQTTLDTLSKDQVIRDRVIAELQSNNTAYARSKADTNPHTGALEQVKKRVNTYHDQIEKETGKINPYIAQHEELTQKCKGLTQEKTKAADSLAALSGKFADLTALNDLAPALRGALVRKAISALEYNTNGYLKTYFDNEIKVAFRVDEDAVDVEIEKSGYTCSYTQLSRGQRSLLRLCFVTAYQKAVSNKCGHEFTTLVYDEVLDGLDSALKIKAFALLESLQTSAETLICIDHAPEFQNMFDRRYHVELVGDESAVTLES